MCTKTFSWSRMAVVVLAASSLTLLLSIGVAPAQAGWALDWALVTPTASEAHPTVGAPFGTDDMNDSHWHRVYPGQGDAGMIWVTFADVPDETDPDNTYVHPYLREIYISHPGALHAQVLDPDYLKADYGGEFSVPFTDLGAIIGSSDLPQWRGADAAKLRKKYPYPPLNPQEFMMQPYVARVTAPKDIDNGDGTVTHYEGGEWETQSLSPGDLDNQTPNGPDKPTLSFLVAYRTEIHLVKVPKSVFRGVTVKMTARLVDLDGNYSAHECEPGALAKHAKSGIPPVVVGYDGDRPIHESLAVSIEGPRPRKQNTKGLLDVGLVKLGSGDAQLEFKVPSKGGTYEYTLSFDGSPGAFPMPFYGPSPDVKFKIHVK